MIEPQLKKDNACSHNLITHAHKVSATSKQIEQVFNMLFSLRERTVLTGGQAEPFYQAAKTNEMHHTIFYSHDYVSSALHEVAHWCVAGNKRRLQDDYGYWYSPDGRSIEQQNQFEQVEVKPQALERIFSRACGIKFRVSADNLVLNCGPSAAFKDAIQMQTLAYLSGDLNERSVQFLQALLKNFHKEQRLCVDDFVLSQLN